MSIRVMTHVWEHSKHKGSELLTLLAIADFAHDDGTHAYPSIGTLAKKTRLTSRNVQLILKKLCASGELHIQAGEGPQGKNLFSIEMKSFQGVKTFQGEKSSHKRVKSSALLQPQISPNPLLETKEDKKEEDPPISPQGVSDVPPKKPIRKTRMPETLESQAALKAKVFTNTLAEWVVSKGISLDLDEQWECFVSKALAKGYQYVNWHEAFKCWLKSPYQVQTPGQPKNNNVLSLFPSVPDDHTTDQLAADFVARAKAEMAEDAAQRLHA